MGFLEIAMWYGIAWVVSLLVILVPGWLTKNRLMFIPLRSALQLPETRWGETIVVLTLLILPLYALKQVLTPDNWRP